MAYASSGSYDDDEQGAAGTVGGDKRDDLHALSVRQFDDIISAVQEERALALVDRRFVSIAGAQWEGGWAQQFANSIMVEDNQTARGVEKIIADYRANRVIVDFRAVDKDASEETAQVLNGMFRADLYWSKGQQATDNAFEEAVQGGYGAWRLTTKYEDEYDPDNDAQRICFEMIGDADQRVFWDMNARLYDKSDAEYCFVLTSYTREAYVEAYGDDETDWNTGIYKAYYDWFTPDVVIVAEKYYYEDESDDLIFLKHTVTNEERREWASDLERGELKQLISEGWKQVKRRKTKRRIVRKLTMNGNREIAPRETLPFDDIPVIPVYGKRWFIDNMERARGHARLAKDNQRIHNVQLAKLTETAAITPIEVPIFFAEEVAGLQDKWATANIDRAPYRLRNPMFDANGQITNAGAPPTLKPPDVPPVTAALIALTRQGIAEATAGDDGADEAKANISAEAMDIAATRTDAKTAIYQDNMKLSWQRCGEIYQGGARRIYFEDGRSVETMDDDGAISTETLYEPVMDEDGVYRIRNDLQRGKYKVIADVTEATATKRDKTVKNLVNAATIVSATAPDLANVLLSTAVMNMDGEGVSDLQDWLRKQLVQQGVIKPTDEEKQAMAEAAQQAAQQPPDPQTQLILAGAQKEQALAGKAKADTMKSLADTELSKAKTQQAMSDANRADADATHTRVEAAHAIARGPEPVTPPAAGDASTSGALAGTPATPKRLGVFNRMAAALRGTFNGMGA